MMPGMNGVELCRRVRAEKKEPYTYIILLTGQQQDEDIVTGMEAGADDYIFKPFNHNELRVRLRAGRRIIELQDELIAAREIFQAKANRDSLTGLLNHEEILGVLEQELVRTERAGKCVSVIMADLDHFKMVNDTYGHMAGDEVLRSAARRMQLLTRAYDSVGRYGGEEFLIILPECGKERAVAFAERLRADMSSEKMDTSEGLIPVTVSLGVAESSKERRLNAYALVKAADEALYLAKGNGRNRVEAAPH
jgi:diguanylate cyclase (GGDEF)-like protein